VAERAGCSSGFDGAGVTYGAPAAGQRSGGMRFAMCGERPGWAIDGSMRGEISRAMRNGRRVGSCAIARAPRLDTLCVVPHSLAGDGGRELIDRVPMKLSQGERDALVLRVEERLGGRGVDRADVRWAVDRVLARLVLPDESPATPSEVFALSAASMPDLSSRVREQLTRMGVAHCESGTATAGRFTVVTLHAHDVARSRIDDLAHAVGAQVQVIDSAGAGSAA
jgi:hypothetical protein